MTISIGLVLFCSRDALDAVGAQPAPDLPDHILTKGQHPCVCVAASPDGSHSYWLVCNGSAGGGAREQLPQNWKTGHRKWTTGRSSNGKLEGTHVNVRPTQVWRIASASVQRAASLSADKSTAARPNRLRVELSEVQAFLERHALTLRDLEARFARSAAAE